MGLSNEERMAKMFWAIHRIVETTRKIDEKAIDPLYFHRERYLRLREIADQMWFAFLGDKRNSAFWILGGDASNDVRGPNGPWGAAIEALCENHRNDPSILRSTKDPKAPFDPFDGFLAVSGLLGHAEGGVARKAAFEAYSWTEGLLYALRRYDDELSKGLRTLDKLAADFQGECYGIFVNDDVYGRAYVLNRILKALYGSEYACLRRETIGADPVLSWMHKENLHHDLSRPMGRDSSLTEIIDWDKWRLTHPVNPENRLVLTLRIAGRRFHYDHKFKTLLKACEEMKPRPRVKILEAEFAKCKATHEKDETENRQRYSEDSEREADAVIHGYRVHDWAKKTRDEPKKAPAKPKAEGKRVPKRRQG